MKRWVLPCLPHARLYVDRDALDAGVGDQDASDETGEHNSKMCDNVSFTTSARLRHSESRKVKVPSTAPHNEVQIQSSEKMPKAIQMPPSAWTDHTQREITVNRKKLIQHSGKTVAA